MSEQVKTKFELRKAIETKDGRTITEIELGRLTVGDMEAVSSEANKMTKAIKMLAASLQLSADDVRKMDAQDFDDASNGLVELMGF